MALPLTQLDASDVEEADAKLPPPAVNGERPLVKLTAAQKKKLLKQAGMQSLDLRKLEAVAEIGQFVSQLGLYAIEAGKLVASQSDIELIFAKTVAVAKKCKEDIEQQIRILEIQDSLMGKRLDAIKIGLKAGAEFQPQPHRGAGGNPPIPFPPNVAVQQVFYAAPPPEKIVTS